MGTPRNEASASSAESRGPSAGLDQEIAAKLGDLEAGLYGELLKCPARRLHDGQQRRGRVGGFAS
jgi:hypothetical protein